MSRLSHWLLYILCDGSHLIDGVAHGDVFIFIGSSRRLMKLLHAEDGGMVMYVKRLKISRRTLQEYRDSGIVPYVKLGGKVLYRESDLEKLLEECYHPAYRKD